MYLHLWLCNITLYRYKSTKDIPNKITISKNCSKLHFRGSIFNHVFVILSVFNDVTSLADNLNNIVSRGHGFPDWQIYGGNGKLIRAGKTVVSYTAYFAVKIFPHMTVAGHIQYDYWYEFGMNLYQYGTNCLLFNRWKKKLKLGTIISGGTVDYCSSTLLNFFDKELQVSIPYHHST